MYQPTLITWVLIIFGIITCTPLLFAQIIILIKPKGQKAKDLLIGEGEDWRDETHFKAAYSLAMADWIIFFPIFIIGIVGMLSSNYWGYLLFAISGAIQLYINTFLLYFEKEYVYPSIGPFKYYTYFWGNFMVWGVASFLYGIFRLNGTIF
ncbi:MAG: hypothetical protein JSW33_14360 [bacterium]|nr:MAG: hypothetical protein JSW33_14360 [bacterium]